jgi:hypothetical protein
MVRRNLANIPQTVARNWVWATALSLLWVLLMTTDVPVIGSLLGFLTAAYTNFLSKGLYLVVVNSTVIPRVMEVRRSGAAELTAKYFKVLGVIRQAFVLLGPIGSLRTALLFGGAGVALSNLLTRNNSSNKYFICVMVAAWLFDALALGAGSMPVRLFRAAYRDIAKRSATFETVYASVACLAAGLAFGFVPGMLPNRGFWDYKGYIIGAILMALGVALGSAGGRFRRGQA